MASKRTRKSTTTPSPPSPSQPQREQPTSPPPPPPHVTVQISNIVCGSNLNCLFDLKHIATMARNAIYNPKRFPASILRIRDPKATGLIFSSGKLQVLGTKSIPDAKLATLKFARILQKLGYLPRVEGFTVQNIVGNADTKMLVRLEGLHRDHWRYAKFEPEIFPGLVYTFIGIGAMKALVFAKGKVVFLGAKSVEDLERAMRNLYWVLLEYRRV